MNRNVEYDNVDVENEDCNGHIVKDSIIEDSNIEDSIIEYSNIENKNVKNADADADVENGKKKRKPRTKVKHEALSRCYDTNSDCIEIGIDEAGRGPMLGRVYTAAVILPKDDSFDHSLMKDSKRFHSDKKIREAAEYIKKNAIMWNIQYAEKEEIDKLNIRVATHKSMHRSIYEIFQQQSQTSSASVSAPTSAYHLLVDGNDFKPYMIINENDCFVQIPHTCIEGGDNKYSAIAAASILAKVARDDYIDDLCKQYPLLDERYGLQSNKGYGTKIHMDGIKKYGISQFHRTSFGICKTEKLNSI